MMKWVFGLSVAAASGLAAISGPASAGGPLVSGAPGGFTNAGIAGPGIVANPVPSGSFRGSGVTGRGAIGAGGRGRGYGRGAAYGGYGIGGFGVLVGDYGYGYGYGPPVQEGQAAPPVPRAPTIPVAAGIREAPSQPPAIYVIDKKPALSRRGVRRSALSETSVRVAANGEDPRVVSLPPR